MAGDHALLDEFTFGGEVETVVEELGPGDGDELIAEEAHFAVKDESLEVKMGKAEDGHSRGIAKKILWSVSRQKHTNANKTVSMGSLLASTLHEKLASRDTEE